LLKYFSKRLEKNWNYFNFFLLKEGLAFTYERMNMINQAYVQYVELDALLWEYIGNRNEKRFEKFGGN